MSEILSGIDYWVSRYQTLIASVIAVGSAAWAVRPIWRQVSIMEAQLEDQRRERLAAKYQMLAELTNLLDAEEWKKSVPYGTVPVTAVSGEVNDLIAAYDARLRRWDEIKNKLRERLTQDEFAAIAEYTNSPNEIFQESGTWVELAKFNGEASQLPFFAVAQPDAGVTASMSRIRQKLEELKGDVVTDIVSPAK